MQHRYVMTCLNCGTRSAFYTLCRELPAQHPGRCRDCKKDVMFDITPTEPGPPK